MLEEAAHIRCPQSPVRGIYELSTCGSSHLSDRTARAHRDRLRSCKHAQTVSAVPRPGGSNQRAVRRTHSRWPTLAAEERVCACWCVDERVVRRACTPAACVGRRLHTALRSIQAAAAASVFLSLRGLLSTFRAVLVVVHRQIARRRCLPSSLTFEQRIAGMRLEKEQGKMDKSLLRRLEKELTELKSLSASVLALSGRSATSSLPGGRYAIEAG